MRLSIQRIPRLLRCDLVPNLHLATQSLHFALVLLGLTPQCIVNKVLNPTIGVQRLGSTRGTMFGASSSS
jgi:hypothetical protein